LPSSPWLAIFRAERHVDMAVSAYTYASNPRAGPLAPEDGLAGVLILLLRIDRHRGPPKTLANMRENGVRSLSVTGLLWRWNCAPAL
jgi:hypothetical protein